MAEEITTIKLSKKTKSRLDNLKVYKKETYEEIVIKMLEMLNLFRKEPEEARRRLAQIETQRKEKGI
jgi:hypothetical protein